MSCGLGTMEVRVCEPSPGGGRNWDGLMGVRESKTESPIDDSGGLSMGMFVVPLLPNFQTSGKFVFEKSPRGLKICGQALHSLPAFL